MTLQITFDQVVEHGEVADAIEALIESGVETDNGLDLHFWRSGVILDEEWEELSREQQNDVNLHVARWFRYEPWFDYYIDADTGKVASRIYDGSIHWTAESQVSLICPTLEQAVSDPNTFRYMAEEALTTHRHSSDVHKWKSLITEIRQMLAALAAIGIK